jgi:hypothetical protein
MFSENALTLRNSMDENPSPAMQLNTQMNHHGQTEESS